MPAIELRQDEIGAYDPAAYRAVRERLSGKSPGSALFPLRGAVVPFSEDCGSGSERAARIYPVPIGPCRPNMEPKGEKVQIRAIMRIVAHVYGLTVNDVLSHRRMAELVLPRQEAMWLARKYTLHSLPQIGRHFAGRDHTTVLHAIRKFDRLIAEGRYTPHADAWIAGWKSYLGERDALVPKVTAPKPVEPEPVIIKRKVLPFRRATPIPFPASVPDAPPESAPPYFSTCAKWTEADVERVTELLAKGWPRSAIAAHLGRSDKSIKAGIARYGITAGGGA